MPTPAVSNESDQQTALVASLERLRDRGDRGALAALRRGLGKEPGTVSAMHRYIVPYLPKASWSWGVRTSYGVAALFALHPESGGHGDLGSATRAIADNRAIELDGKTSIEKRFSALLEVGPDRLFGHLRQIVSLAASAGVPVNWHSLHRDLNSWNHSDRWVQRKWATSLWRPGPTPSASRTKGTD